MGRRGRHWPVLPSVTADLMNVVPSAPGQIGTSSRRLGETGFFCSLSSYSLPAHMSPRHPPLHAPCSGLPFSGPPQLPLEGITTFASILFVGLRLVSFLFWFGPATRLVGFRGGRPPPPILGFFFFLFFSSPFIRPCILSNPTPVLDARPFCYPFPPSSPPSPLRCIPVPPLDTLSIFRLAYPRYSLW
jgi:hypothetical protein